MTQCASLVIARHQRCRGNLFRIIQGDCFVSYASSQWRGREMFPRNDRPIFTYVYFDNRPAFCM